MVPNPFRSLSRVLPGRGGSQDDETAEHDADAQAGESGDRSPEPGGFEEVNTSVHEGADGSAASEQRAASEHEDSAEEPDSDEHPRAEDAGSGEHDGNEEIDASDTPAPSIGPHTKITQEDAETRLARHEQSNVDAMGQDKRREVIGGSYSPSFAKQATLYGIFLLVVGLLVVGGILAVNEFDQPPEEQKLEAPWKDSTDPAKASEIDFPPDSAPKQVPTGPDSTSKGGADRA